MVSQTSNLLLRILYVVLPYTQRFFFSHYLVNLPTPWMRCQPTTSCYNDNNCDNQHKKHERWRTGCRRRGSKKKTNTWNRVQYQISNYDNLIMIFVWYCILCALQSHIKKILSTRARVSEYSEEWTEREKKNAARSHGIGNFVWLVSQCVIINAQETTVSIH